MIDPFTASSTSVDFNMWLRSKTRNPRQRHSSSFPRNSAGFHPSTTRLERLGTRIEPPVSHGLGGCRLNLANVRFAPSVSNVLILNRDARSAPRRVVMSPAQEVKTNRVSPFPSSSPHPWTITSSLQSHHAQVQGEGRARDRGSGGSFQRCASIAA